MGTLPQARAIVRHTFRATRATRGRGDWLCCWRGGHNPRSLFLNCLSLGSLGLTDALTLTYVPVGKYPAIA
jgi:hypothetical protein